MLSLNNIYIKVIRLSALLLLFKSNLVSQNLIQNGSFEYYTTDLGSSGCVSQFDSLKNWQSINQSPDVYVSSCTFTNNYSVPNNRNGISYPMSGNSYVGIVCYYKPLEVKEYFGQQLSSALIPNRVYYTSFYVSRADRISYSIKSIGAYFSISQPSVVVSNTYIPANPQIENHSGFLTDTVNWVKIEGYFTAQGGEQYITIGNFNSNSNTDTLNTGTTNPIPFDGGSAYYYIDSVSLYDSLDYVTNIKKYENDFKVNVYPNPITSTLNIINENNQLQNATIQIQNYFAQVVFTSSFNSQINLSSLSAGMYFLTVEDKNHKKIVKILKQ